jgi:hypothetical protein
MRVVFSEVADSILFAFAPTEACGEIEERFALHLSIVSGQVTGVPVDFVQVLPKELRDNRRVCAQEATKWLCNVTTAS